MKRTLTTALCTLHFALCTFASFYFQPEVGFVGDPMPFYDPVQQTFRVYYLQEYRPNGKTYHPIFAVETANLYDYRELGEVLPTGSFTYNQDAAIGTGSVVYVAKENTYYCYYTGHKDAAGESECREQIMRATSKDGVRWTKDATFRIRPSDYYYYQNDFRDPEVFLVGDVWHMLVATGKDGRNCLAEFTSSDCKKWENKGVFMTTMWDRFYECPNVFRIGDWWYLVYSEQHHEIRRVQYFKARSYEGLRLCTANDQAIWPDDHEGYLDGRGLYAGKTASDGDERYLWGWCPTRPNQNNTTTNNKNGEPDWAGTMVAHRLIQHEDGSLTLGAISGVEQQLQKTATSSVENQLTLAAGDIRQMSLLGEENHISMTVEAQGAYFGIDLCREVGYPKYYTLQLRDAGSGKRKIEFHENGDGSQGYIPNIDSYTFAAPADGVYHIDLYSDGSVLTLYINDLLCYTNRVYGMVGNYWGLRCTQGSIRVTDIHQYEPGHDITSMRTAQDEYPQVRKLLRGQEVLLLRDGNLYTLLGNKQY